MIIITRPHPWNPPAYPDFHTCFARPAYGHTFFAAHDKPLPILAHRISDMLRIAERLGIRLVDFSR